MHFGEIILYHEQVLDQNNPGVTVTAYEYTLGGGQDVQNIIGFNEGTTTEEVTLSKSVTSIAYGGFSRRIDFAISGSPIKLRAVDVISSTNFKDNVDNMQMRINDDSTLGCVY